MQELSNLKVVRQLHVFNTLTKITVRGQALHAVSELDQTCKVVRQLLMFKTLIEINA
jgi:hypothetical protein